MHNWNINKSGNVDCYDVKLVIWHTI